MVLKFIPESIKKLEEDNNMIPFSQLIFSPTMSMALQLIVAGTRDCDLKKAGEILTEFLKEKRLKDITPIVVKSMEEDHFLDENAYEIMELVGKEVNNQKTEMMQNAPSLIKDLLAINGGKANGTH